MNPPGKDRISGASEITSNSTRFFFDLVSNSSAGTSAALSEEIIRSAKELVFLQPSMGSVLTLASALVHKCVLLAKEDVPVDRSRSHLLDFLEKCSRDAELSALKITGLANDLIPDGAIVATFSRSSLVRRTLVRAAEEGKNIRVLVSEGRPLFEGLLFSRELSDAGIESILVADSALPLFLSRAEIFLLGADTVTERSFINKTGTYAMCLVAREHNVPVYCLSGTDKFLSAQTPLLRIAENDPGEIVNFELPHVTVKNVYFEETPLKLVRSFVTESGYLSPDEASAQADAVQLAEEIEQ